MNYDDCNDEQKDLIKQLQAKHEDLVAKDAAYYDAEFFSRWLVARDWSLAKADEMLTAAKKWRADEDIDGMVVKYGAEGNDKREFLQKFCPSTFHGVDKRGCPIYVERVGAFDATGLLASIVLDDLKTHHIFQLERGERLKREAGLKLQNKPFKKHLAIEDLGGLGWGHMTSACVELTKSLVVLDESYYPESMEKLFIINAPWIFNATWKLLKPLISERTLAKITICGADYYDKLAEFIDEEEIPAEFGGKCTKCNGNCVGSGGKVPESFHRGGHKMEDPEKVHEVTVGRSSVHEVRVPVKADALLCYEFWTDSYDLQFGVVFVSNDAAAKRMPMIPTKKVDSHKAHVSGDVTAVADGAIILLFDNTHSMLRSKKLSFNVRVPTANDSDLKVEESDHQ